MNDYKNRVLNHIVLPIWRYFSYRLFFFISLLLKTSKFGKFEVNPHCLIVQVAWDSKSGELSSSPNYAPFWLCDSELWVSISWIVFHICTLALQLLHWAVPMYIEPRALTSPQMVIRPVVRSMCLRSGGLGSHPSLALGNLTAAPVFQLLWPSFFTCEMAGLIPASQGRCEDPMKGCLGSTLQSE